MSAFTFHNSIKIHLVPIIIVSNNYFQYYLIWRLLISLFITPSLSSSHVLLHSTKGPKPKDLHFTVMCGKKKTKNRHFRSWKERIFLWMPRPPTSLDKLRLKIFLYMHLSYWTGNPERFRCVTEHHKSRQIDSPTSEGENYAGRCSPSCVQEPVNRTLPVNHNKLASRCYWCLLVSSVKRRRLAWCHLRLVGKYESLCCEPVGAVITSKHHAKPHVMFNPSVVD